MSTPEDRIAETLRVEVDARLVAYRTELRGLLREPDRDRISELEGLIAYLEGDAPIKVNPRKAVTEPELTPLTETPNARTR